MSKKSGFTLFELIVCLGIVFIILTVIVGHGCRSSASDNENIMKYAASAPAGSEITLDLADLEAIQHFQLKGWGVKSIDRGNPDDPYDDFITLIKK